ARLLAEGARQAMQDFLRRARHELKAPLNAILGTAQLMHDPGPGRRDDIERWVDQLRHAGTHLSDMLDDLMVVSDSSVGHIEVRDAPLPLRPVVLAAVDVAGHGGSPMDWQIDAGDDALEVHGDARRIRQVLVNLLSNAVKYSPAGGQVRLRVVAEADTVRVQVEDDGLGLSAEQQAGLFQAFNRLGREHSAIEGSGIGLYLSQQLALRMGGRIEVDSIEGVGSRFTLCLRRASMGARVPAPRAQEPAGRLVILAVEDDPVACAILRQLALRHTYWHLVLRDRLAGALEQVRLTRPAVILLDSHLPDGDGRSLMSAMCADPALAGIPVVLISGDEGADPGMVRACVPKPWNIDNLVQTIHHLANATGAASAANAADTNASAAVRLAS
ncbi:MAG: response regulator, partial [Burkholderiales bacterium]|nr:response regulator [Burkholderiales bacterium]